MKSPTPENHDDEHRAMREALQRDAARLREEPFVAELHYATMRRIRAIGDTNRASHAWRMAALGAACVLVLIAVVAFAPWNSPRPAVALTGKLVEPASVEPMRASARAYQLAADRSDEALLAMLDRDARDLLPPTASAFTNPLR